MHGDEQIKSAFRRLRSFQRHVAVGRVRRMTRTGRQHEKRSDGDSATPSDASQLACLRSARRSLAARRRQCPRRTWSALALPGSV